VAESGQNALDGGHSPDFLFGSFKTDGVAASVFFPEQRQRGRRRAAEAVVEPLTLATGRKWPSKSSWRASDGRRLT
jgi:hypothetical protein